MSHTARNAPPQVIDLGQMSYAAAYAQQEHHHAEVLGAREQGDAEAARILLVEHVPPVITVTRRPGAAGHLLVSSEALAAHGVELAETDRGGDITYHGPGQLVVYPIVDLNRHGLRLHDYMRLLESAVIDTLAEFGVQGQRDPGATGVWVHTAQQADQAGAAKICAMGVRVRRWVSLHGLALNVTTDLNHFGLIVPCGLHGRSVTSLQSLLGAEKCPSMSMVKGVLSRTLAAHLGACAGSPSIDANSEGD